MQTSLALAAAAAPAGRRGACAPREGADGALSLAMAPRSLPLAPGRVRGAGRHPQRGAAAAGGAEETARRAGGGVRPGPGRARGPGQEEAGGRAGDGAHGAGRHAHPGAVEGLPGPLHAQVQEEEAGQGQRREEGQGQRAGQEVSPPSTLAVIQPLTRGLAWEAPRWGAP